jgi:transcriptional regulator with XRE-family HTH domain
MDVSELRRLRKLKGLSQEQLAEEAGVHVRTIQRAEQGESTPRGDTMQRIASVLRSRKDVGITSYSPSEGYISAMNLSVLFFFIFPLFAVLAPLFMWLFKKPHNPEIDQAGKIILNFQVTWMLITVTLFFLPTFQFTFLRRWIALSDLPFNPAYFPDAGLGLTLIFFMILFNTGLVLYNAFRAYYSRPLQYPPSFPFVK